MSSVMAISGLLKPAHRLLRPGSLWISAPWGLQACRRRQNHTGGQKLRAPAAEQGSNGCGRTLWSQEKQAEEEDKQELSDSSPSSFSLRPILSSGMTMLEALASPVVNPMEDKRQREMQEVEVPPLCPEPDFLASSHEERRRSLFRPPEPCSLISSVLTGDWVQMLEAAVLELDGIVEHEAVQPIPLDCNDLEEQILHHWLVHHRRDLFPRHPFLLAYEWRAGNNALFFQGDVLLWNGSTEILSVELKTLKDHEGADQTVESLRLQKVDSQAQKGEVFALSFLAQKPQPLPLKLAMLATGELPSVHGISVTNHFNEEHHPSLSEKAREQLKEGFREFRSRVTVVTPAVQGKDISKGHKAPTPLPALETLQFSAGDSTEDDDTLGDEEDGRSSEPQDGESSLDERITNPQSVEDICLSIIHVLSKCDDSTCRTSILGNELYILFGKRMFRDVVGTKLGVFLTAHCQLFPAKRGQNGELTVSLPKKVSDVRKKRPLTVEDLQPYVKKSELLMKLPQAEKPTPDDS